MMRKNQPSHFPISLMVSKSPVSNPERSRFSYSSSMFASQQRTMRTWTMRTCRTRRAVSSLPTQKTLTALTGQSTNRRNITAMSPTFKLSTSARSKKPKRQPSQAHHKTALCIKLALKARLTYETSIQKSVNMSPARK